MTDEHPTVQRPNMEDLAEAAQYLVCDDNPVAAEVERAKDYIEQTEHYLAGMKMLYDGALKEIWEQRGEVTRLSEAIREKDRRLEESIDQRRMLLEIIDDCDRCAAAWTGRPRTAPPAPAPAPKEE